MRKVLITGGTGFLGSHLIKRIINEVESITIATTSIRQKTTLKALGVDIDKINLVKGDVRDFDFVRLLFNEYEFDTVFHLAAMSEVVKCQNDPKLALDVNIGGTINVLEVARTYGNVKAIVVSSSDKAYGTGDRLPYLEDDKLNGKGTYEASKSCTDLIARAYATNYDVPVVVTRCSNLYGVGDMNFTRVIPNNIKKVLDGERPVIWKGSEKSTREFLYIDDAVDAYVSLVKNIDKTKGNAYNIGSGEEVTIGELLELLLSKMDTDLTIDYVEKDIPEITHQYLDSNKIKNDTGWEAQICLSVGLEETIKRYKEIL
jgi:CDP-glucose 4,6-dehydratase